MSTFIPILSSSPPPMDDDPSASDDWGDDEFGGFQTANANAVTDPESDLPVQGGGDSKFELSGNAEQGLTSASPVSVPGTFHQSDILSKLTPSQDGQSDSHDDDLEDGPNLKPSTVPKSDAQDNTSQDSVVTDSGLCSDVSPGPKCEDESDLNSLNSQQKEMEAALTTSQDSGNDGPEADDVYSSDASISYFTGTGDADIEPLDLKTPGYDDTGDDYDEDSFEQFNSAREVSTNLQLDSPDTECSEESKTESATQEMLDVSPTTDSKLQQDSDNVDDSDCKTETLNTLQTDLSEGEDVNDSQSGAEDDIVSPVSHIDQPESDRHLRSSLPLKEASSVDVAAEKCDNVGTQEASISALNAHENDFGEFSASDGFGEFLASNVIDQQTSGNKNKADPSSNATAGGEAKDEFDDDDDEWAFHDAKPAGTEESDEWAFQNADQRQSAFGDGFAQFGDGGNSGESDWASFADATAPPTDVLTEDDDEFGDFEDVKTEDPVSASVNSFLRGDIPVMDKVLKQCFHRQDINGNPVDEIDQILVHLNQESVRTEEKQEIVPGHRHPVTTNVTVDMNIWNHLKDIENTKALQYHWRDSTNKKCLLTSLAIDARNILMNVKRQGGTTMFSATPGNTILEPLQPVPAQSSASILLNSNNNMNSSSEDQSQPGTDPQQANTPQQDIPAVEFDWSSSGLTNPLDSLENELLQSIEPPRSDQPKSLQPLETLLANMKYSSTAPKSNKNEVKLSPEALRIIQTFPDISFMKAKFLVFPLRSMTENEHDDN